MLRGHRKGHCKCHQKLMHCRPSYPLWSRMLTSAQGWLWSSILASNLGKKSFKHAYLLVLSAKMSSRCVLSRVEWLEHHRSAWKSGKTGFYCVTAINGPILYSNSANGPLPYNISVLTVTVWVLVHYVYWANRHSVLRQTRYISADMRVSDQYLERWVS